MRPQINKEQMERILDILTDAYKIPFRENDADDIAQYKLSVAAVLLMYAELGFIKDDFSFSIMDYYGNSTVDEKLSSFYCSMNDFGGETLRDIYEQCDWHFLIDEELEEVRASTDEFDLEEMLSSNADGCANLELVTVYNEDWKKFFDYLREFGGDEGEELKTLKDHFPDDFLQFFYTWDHGGQFPEYGYYRHVFGFDGGDCELGMESLCIYFPLETLVVEYYMHNIINNNPKLKERMGL